MRLARRILRPALPALAGLLVAAGAPAIPDAAAETSAAKTSPPKTSPPAHLRYGRPRKIATLADARVDESSGLAAGRTRPGVFWTHNDSGDAARLYAFDRKGRHLAEVLLKGVRADDWEDIASVRLGGRNLLVVADIGDNLASRTVCTLYVLEEPDVGSPDEPVTAAVPVRRTIRFVYEDGPRDCEALGVDPATGRFYFVTKEGLRCRVFELDAGGDREAGPARGAGAKPRTAARNKRPYTARCIGEIATSPVVAMDISPDGRRAIVLTYADALEFVRARGETWRRAFARKPRLVVMPRRRQGEAVCYGPDGRTLYLTSEHTPTPLFEVPVLKPGKQKR